MVDSKELVEDLLDKIQEEQMIAYLDEVNQSLSSWTMDSEEKEDYCSNVNPGDIMRINASMKRFERPVPMIATQEGFWWTVTVDVQLSRDYSDWTSWCKNRGL